MKKEFTFNFVGKVSTALTTLILMPFVGHFYGDYFLGLYGILATITVVVLILEAGLSSSLIAELSKHREDSKSEVVSVFLFEYFVFFILFGVFSLLLVIIFGYYSHHVIPDILDLPRKSELFVIYGSLCFLSFLLLFFQSVSYALGLFRFYNVVLTLTSLARVLIPSAFVLINSDLDFFQFLYSLLMINALCILVLFIGMFVLGKLRLKPSLNFHHVIVGLKCGFPVFLVSISSVFYTQIDKFFGMKYLSLEGFGVFSTAASLAAAPMIFAGVVYSVMLPKFSYLQSSGNEMLIDNYKKYSNLLMCFLGCLYVTGVFFIWLVIDILEPSFLVFEGGHYYFIFVFSVMFLGSIFQSYTSLPYALQVARKNVSTTLKLNYFLMPLSFALLFVFCELFAGYGLPLFWVLYNLFFLFFLNYIFIQPFLASCAKTQSF